mmetsp:Transcript_8332/g.12545  ORF Transcript_8332/g.12545 Transcript_8332/m.12545 type:complete len:490 (+) Transcript_8332:18-1487(+)|eukprot:CAMPEP_0203666492 /NCGR_PEP_ID=MMETSP0090-20130426/3515_1 /ASSEMBLY_ACC=CAM_ASM_001088 /TAXON_ID=426623 /ORGANISM="Chaetoceros affinis, Strain CCMP159" /LENGTH=489 /DNA_ID=CAMNT_0050530387 /DNA_START=11 /DNA_END=1480 /DNA_ORIENTATION=-
MAYTNNSTSMGIFLGMMLVLLPLLLVLLLPSSAEAFSFSFSSSSSRRRVSLSDTNKRSSNWHSNRVPLRASTLDDNNKSKNSSSSNISSSSNNNNNNGISTFERWFQSLDNSNSNNNNQSMKYLRHNFFSNGRGLEFIGNTVDIDALVDSNQAIITLPKDYVLQSTMTMPMNKDSNNDNEYNGANVENEWDVNLALQLLNECQLGEQSSIYGYCALLTQGNDFTTSQPCPPSTAPDALRNWSTEEKELLSATKRGQRLLNVEEKQCQEWKNKYAALLSSSTLYTYEQFKWAMEAVHSRAFKGNFSGRDPLKELSKALIPFAAAAFGLSYIRSSSSPYLFNNSSDDINIVTVLLLLVACSPVILNFVNENIINASGNKSVDVVMLPFIDSANHKESARSTIEFDPLKGAFTVSMEGSNCIERDEGGRSTSSGDDNSNESLIKQFYISYGEKRDTELLLNYGFLNGVREAYENRGDRRRLLAEIFNSRSLQ